MTTTATNTERRRNKIPVSGTCPCCGQRLPLRNAPPFDLHLPVILDSIFRILWNAKGHWVSNDVLARQVWGYAGTSKTNLRSAIYLLRKRLDAVGLTVQSSRSARRIPRA